MSRMFVPLLAALLYATGVAPAQATLLSMDDLVFGAGSITYDEATNLEWLDVTASVQRSYDDMVGNDGSNEFLPGGDFEGWRYATTDEWTEFLSHAGIAPLPFSNSSNPTGSVEALISLVGATLTEQFRVYTLGILGDTARLCSSPLTNCHRWGELSLVSTLPGGGVFDRERAGLSGAFPDRAAQDDVGHWLVRVSNTTPVSAPGTLALLGTGLAGLSVMRRRRRRD